MLGKYREGGRRGWRQAGARAAVSPEVGRPALTPTECQSVWDLLITIFHKTRFISLNRQMGHRRAQAYAVFLTTEKGKATVQCMPAVITSTVLIIHVMS